VIRRLVLSLLFLALPALPALAATPDIGEHAPDFTLATPDGANISLQSVEKTGKTVLVVLRGFPGYQCPYCTRQAQDFISHADDFKKAGAQVLMVYPGPPADLSGHAKDFLNKQQPLPENVHLVIDPDYSVTNKYDLRWEGAHETAYPSTFILDKDGVIRFRKISKEHADRLSAADALTQLANVKGGKA
jgi:peroxiredoxin